MDWQEAVLESKKGTAFRLTKLGVTLRFADGTTYEIRKGLIRQNPLIEHWGEPSRFPDWHALDGKSFASQAVQKILLY